MNINVTVNQMLTLFFVLVVGYAARKLKIMSDMTDRLLSKLVVNITVPCTIILAIVDGADGISGGEGALFLLICAAVYAISLLLAFFAPRLLRGGIKDSGLVSFMMAFGNVAFMGFPVCQAIFGSESMFYVALFNIPFTLLVYSVGIVMVSGGQASGAVSPQAEQPAVGSAKRPRAGGFGLRLLLNPSFVSAVAAVALFAFKLRLPGIVSGGVEIISKMTTPSAMLIIGSSLAPVSPRAVFAEWRLYFIAFVKLAVIPAAIWFIMRLFVHDALPLGVLTVLAGMPAATSAPMLAYEYGGNTAFASGGVFLTTLLSVATIPLLTYFLL
ncbi:MAG: AEC family transporter [Oscillospiraceae bacterium]|nr:AEC family transporter [Oscillospiraceae bacterium]